MTPSLPLHLWCGCILWAILKAHLHYKNTHVQRVRNIPFHKNASLVVDIRSFKGVWTLQLLFFFFPRQLGLNLCGGLFFPLR